jgi:polar amino acid transport system substrate-binding protein
MVTGMEKGSSYGFAVLKGKNGALLSAFNTGLSNLKANGTYQKILDKYIATE